MESGQGAADRCGVPVTSTFLYDRMFSSQGIHMLFIVQDFEVGFGILVLLYFEVREQFLVLLRSDKVAAEFRVFQGECSRVGGVDETEHWPVGPSPGVQHYAA